jgi:TfoX/Sxy family transcriptional regulator of competence genes
VAFDQALATRVRRTLAGRKDVVEKRMFGGLTFMVANKMCCGIVQDELMIRLAPSTELAELGSPNVRVCDFTRKPMRGFFQVNTKGCLDQEGVDHWVRLALSVRFAVTEK